MDLKDPYAWIDPGDAVFVASCREALKIEREAWRRCDAERRRLWSKLRRIEELLDGEQGGQGG